MKIKTSELTTSALCWAVAQASSIKVHIVDMNVYPNVVRKECGTKPFNPDFDWALAGPIIEREINKIWRNMGGTFGAQIKYRVPYYSPTYDADIGADAFINKHGPTPLVAAMRCFVASKLGDEVDVPDGLIGEGL